jgi:hypothetical protein
MALPNAICVGAPKCGTTSLYRLLGRHPMVCTATREEPEYFTNDDEYSNGTAWYEWRYFRNHVDEPVRIDINPSYLYEPGSLKRIRETLGDVPLIVLLRDPVDRAISHYYHNIRFFLEERSFDAAVSAELAADVAGIPLRKDTRYVGLGRYLPYVTQLREAMPGSRILFLEFQAFFADVAAGLTAVARFLGIDAAVGLDTSVHVNRGGRRTVTSLPRGAIIDTGGRKMTVSADNVAFVTGNRADRVIFNPSEAMRRFAEAARSNYACEIDETVKRDLWRRHYRDTQDVLAQATGLDLAGWSRGR